ncbi:ParE family toxin-like protein [Yersinia rohdei]
MTLSGNRIPLRIYIGATQILNQYRRGAAHPRRMYKTGYLSLRITYRWRLLSKDGGQHWEAMSHERYNSQKDKK